MRRVQRLAVPLLTLLLAACGQRVMDQSLPGTAEAAVSAAPMIATSASSDAPPMTSPTPNRPTPPAQPLGPDGDGPVQHHSARIEDIDGTPRPTPVRLRIPALGIDASVAAFGVKGDGQMAVPDDADTVAWYEYGPSPGEDGSAVLAGHVDYDGRRGVFFTLSRLDAGDEVVVEFAAGGPRTFIVRERASIGKRALPIDELFRRRGRPVLTLITCGGEFDAAARSYRSNVIVRAEPADA